MVRTTVSWLLVVVLGLAGACTALSACKDDFADEDHTHATKGITRYKASQLVAAADWNSAVKVTVQMVEASAGSVLSFSPKDLSFEAGKPVVLTIQNAAANASKHYYTAESFYRSVAWRKAQTTQAEYKAPYFKAFELLIGGTIELYFVPAVPGIYDVGCTLPDHAIKGMVGTITVTGDPAVIDQEVAWDWNPLLDLDPRTNDKLTPTLWGGKTDVTVEMRETDQSLTAGTLAYAYTVPAGFTAFTKDAAYKLTIQNKVGNKLKHYYTASDFYKKAVWRKAEDKDAEVKVPYFSAIELLLPTTTAAASTSIFFVPTQAGSYTAKCTITGHETAGMTHTVTVQ